MIGVKLLLNVNAKKKEKKKETPHPPTSTVPNLK